MNLVCPNCRTRLSAEDFAFIQSSLGKSKRDGAALGALLLDPEVLDSILDQEMLFQAVQDRAQTLEISPQLYFYLLVRQTLLKANIDDKELADYVASLLVDFTREDRQSKSFPELKAPLRYLVDIVTEIEKADYYHRFFLYAHLGNQTLFLSGLFLIIFGIENNVGPPQGYDTTRPWGAVILKLHVIIHWPKNSECRLCTMICTNHFIKPG